MSPKAKKLSSPRKKLSSRTNKPLESPKKEHKSVICTKEKDNLDICTEVDRAADDLNNEDTENLGVSSHIQQLVTGIKTFGSNIKSSFSFNKSPTNIDPIPEHDNHNNNISKTPSKPSKRKSYFGSFMAAMTGSSDPIELAPEQQATLTESNLRNKPFKRNSFLGSFIQAVTGTGNPSGADEEVVTQQGYLTSSALSHFLRKKTERNDSNKKIVPVS